MKKDKSGYSSAFDMVSKGNFDDVPKQYWYYKDFVSYAVSLNGLALSKASVALKNNYSIVESAIKQNPLAIVCASKIMQKNPKLKKLATKLFYRELKKELEIVCLNLERQGVTDFPYAELKDIIFRERLARLTIDELLALDAKTTNEINDKIFNSNQIYALLDKQKVYSKFNIPEIENTTKSIISHFAMSLLCVGGTGLSVAVARLMPSLEIPMAFAAIINAVNAVISADRAAVTMDKSDYIKAKVDPALQSQLGITYKEILKYRNSGKIYRRIEKLEKEL